MGTIADSLFTVMLSWVRALVNAIWALFSSEDTTLLGFLGRNWVAIALILVAVGLVVDWLVWLLRWRPYHLLALRVRRLLHIGEPEEDEPQEEHSRYAPPPQEPAPQEESWLPEPPGLSETDEQAAMLAAESVPDETLGQYPGMRYDSQAAYAPPAEMDGTRRYAAVHAEGPGAAEVNRRRAEIDAWQLQMQEEARQRAQAERAAREAQAAQAAYEAEQQRLAQEEYERQLAEYERQRAQYERDLAEYERQKAEYDAAMARANGDVEAAQDLGDASSGAHRRRRAQPSYSDHVDGEDVSELPAPPAWTQPEQHAPQARAQSGQPAQKKSRLRGGMERMARMIEPEEEEVAGIASLPPRVNPGTAYRPAKQPPKR